MNDPKPFYGADGLNVETYDARISLEGTSVEGDVAFFIEESGRAGGAVLELGSGTGRVTWPLAEAGFEVVGLDCSEPMIRRAEAKRPAHPESVRKRVRFVQGDMRHFRLDGTFALAIIPFRAFQGLLEPGDQYRSLTCIREHLAPGGRLVIDLFDPRLDLCLPGAKLSTEREDAIHPESENPVQVRIVNRVNDPVRQVFREDWCFREIGADGRCIREEWERLELRWTYRQEARYLFELARFEVEAEYSDFHRSPPTYGQEQVWVLRRP
jgi:SAM-dependent methyltransferase